MFCRCSGRWSAPTQSACSGRQAADSFIRRNTGVAHRTQSGRVRTWSSPGTSSCSCNDHTHSCQCRDRPRPTHTRLDCTEGRTSCHSDMEEEEGKEGGKLARKCGKGGVQRLKLDFLLLFFYCDAIRRQPCILPEHGLASLASRINRTGDPGSPRRSAGCMDQGRNR